MNNGYTNLNPGITVESVNFFSASFAAAKVVPVSSVLLSGLGAGKFDFSINICCQYKDEAVFSFERTYDRISCDMFDKENKGRLFVRFSYSDFTVNYQYLNSLEEALKCDIVTKISVNGQEYEIRNSITINAFDEFAGIDTHPETLAAYVAPLSCNAQQLASGTFMCDEWTSCAEAYENAGTIIKNIRNKNIICVKRDGYSPEKRQRITPVDMLTGKSSVVATPLELAVLFCSVAEGIGLDTVIVYVKNTMGIVSVFCGVNVCRKASFSLNESMTKIRRALDDGDMFLFDPAVLSSAQTVDIEHASFLASEIMHKSGTDMMLAVGVGKCLKDIIGLDYKRNNHVSDARTALAEIYSGISGTKAFKLFSGEYSSYDVIPFVGFDEERFNRAYDEEIIFKPMEISEKTSDFKEISDNFGAFAFSGFKTKEYNRTERALAIRQYNEFQRRIESKSHTVSGLYEKVFHERASRMCFGSTPGFKNYLISGFLRMTDAKRGETLWFPISFAEADVRYDYDYSFRLKNKTVMVNQVLASYFECPDSVIANADSIEKIFALFEDVAVKEVKSGEYTEAVVIKEYALIKADLSDVVLWSDIRRNGKKMLNNESFADVLTENKSKITEDSGKSFVFPRFLPERLEKTVLSDRNTVIGGKSVKEKNDIAVNKIIYSISEGKKVVVTSAKDEFNEEIYKQLEKEGFSELMLRLDGKMQASVLIDAIKTRINEINDTPVNPGSAVSGDYAVITERIKAYSDVLSAQDAVLGITLPDGILSYCRASETCGGKKVTLLPVGENAFTDMTQHKFNVLFDRAEKLVATASEALKASGMYISSELKKHPLYPVKKPCSISEVEMGPIFDIISRINGVISDYRDTFYDISDHIGIDVSDIKDIKGLHALNELYLLVISARELEIPNDITGSEMTGFAAGASKLKTELGRAENIEYRLRFFSKEIFEDVDTLLSGYSPSEADRGNFIKKYLVKKNNKEVLLQYVPDEKRGEFNQHNIEDIYLLLEEYRKIKESTSVTDSYLGKENTVKLAEMIKNAEVLLADIYPGITENENMLADKIGKICDFVKAVSNDTLLSKKLTYARAKFAQVYSDNDCLISELEERLRASFAGLYFESGILSYDGIGFYLKELERNIPGMDVWNKWLAAKECADEFLPAFSEYIENYGVKADTDRIFASSLILPSVGYLVNKYDIIKHKKNFENARAKYPVFYEKARKLSSVNAVLSYRQRLKHFAETENLSSLDEDIGLSLRAFVNKHKRTVLTVFPVIFADAFDVGSMFGNDTSADVVVAGCFENTESILLSALAVSKNMFLVKYTDVCEKLTNKLVKSGALNEDVSYSVYHADRTLGALSGINTFYGFVSDMPETVLVNVNGTMRRVSDGANAQEAESCVSKAAELFSKQGKSVGIFTVTHGQAAFIKHLLSLNCESDEKLAEGVETGFIKVYAPSEVCFDDCDMAIISLGAAVDKNGSIGWTFGCGETNRFIGAVLNAFNCVKEKTFIVCSLTVKEVTRLKGTGYEAEKLFFTILSASLGLTVMDSKDAEEGTSGYSAVLLRNMDNVVPAIGRYASIAEGYDTETGKLYMYECDAQGKVKDRLFAELLMKENGNSIESISALDGILDILDVKS